MDRYVPWGGRDQDELGEEMRVGDGSEDTNHGRKRVTDEDAGMNLKLFKNGEKIVDEAFNGGVAFEVVVVRIGSTSPHIIIQNHTVIIKKMRNQVLPH